jgi:putative tricarboxylic transport membrane protein
VKEGTSLNPAFDRWAALAYFAVGAAFVYGSLQLSHTAYGSQVGPDVFPMGLGAVLMLLAVRLLVDTFRLRPSDEEDAKGNQAHLRQFGALLLSVVVYIGLLETLGYVLSTFGFLLAGFQIMERGKWLSSVMIAAVFSIGVYGLFVGVLQGTLPGFPTWLTG